MGNILLRILVYLFMSFTQVYITSCIRDLEQLNKEKNMALWTNYAGDKTLANVITVQMILSKMSPLTTYDINTYGVSIANNLFRSNKESAYNFCSAAGILCDDLTLFYNQHPAAMTADIRVAHRYSYRGTGFFFDTNPTIPLFDWYLESSLLSTKEALYIPTRVFTQRTSLSLHRRFLPSKLVRAFGNMSTENLSNIMEQLHIPNNSSMAKVMHATSSFCDQLEKNPENDQDVQRICVKSIEELSTFLSSVFSSNVKSIKKMLFPIFDEEDNDSFKVLKVEKQVDETSKFVSCHSLIFPYQVYLCHSFKRSLVYSVIMKLDTKKDIYINAIALCHTDTTKWSPHHPAFQALGNIPGDGTVPCHFLKNDEFVFVKDVTIE